MLEAKLGEFLIIARRHGKEWYVGAMTDWTARDLEIDFSFLPKGPFQMNAYQDGVNANRYGDDYKRINIQVSRDLPAKTAPGRRGGWAAHIQPIQLKKAK